MIIPILIGVASVILIFLVIVELLPNEFRVTRSAAIAASQAVVFAQINDFHKWEAWSPWAKLDPAARNSFEGAPAGVGAIFTWSGNKKIGEGRMTITDSHPSDLVRLNLEFIRPFPGKSVTEFTFKPNANNQTVMTWTMTGKHSFIAKAFCLFMNMDKMVGGDFEKGLAQIKIISEAAAK